MQDTPTQKDMERDYHAGYARIMWFAEQARQRGWRMSDRDTPQGLKPRSFRHSSVVGSSSMRSVGTTH